MSQRLIYGKTIKIEGDSLAFDGATFMDPYDDSGGILPMLFSDTAQQNSILNTTGTTGATTVNLTAYRNQGRAYLEITPTTTAYVSTGTSFTITGIPTFARPSGNINFAITMFNLTTTLPVQILAVLSSSGVLTFNNVTAGSSYSFRFGWLSTTYFAS